MIPEREAELGLREQDRALSRERPVVQRTINRLERSRRVVTRHDTLASSDPAMVIIAMTGEEISRCKMGPNELNPDLAA